MGCLRALWFLQANGQRAGENGCAQALRAEPPKETGDCLGAGPLQSLHFLLTCG